jgi:tetratricopeptide (TPR) repeat protein
MNPETDYTDLIERYLDGEMEPAEKNEFEEKLANNAELAEELALHQTIRFGVENQPLMEEGDPYGVRAFAEEAKAIRAKKKLINLRLRYGGVAVAAVISILILINLGSTPNYQSQIPDPFTQARSVEQKEQIQKLDEAYDNGQYEAGLQRVDSLIAHQDDSLGLNSYFLRYLKGHFYLKQSRLTEAIATFESLVAKNRPENSYFMKSYWCLGIAQGLSGDEEAARQTFQTLLQHPDLKPREKEEYEGRLKKLGL